MLAGEDQAADSGVRSNSALETGEQLLKSTLTNSNSNNNLNYQMDQLQNHHQNLSRLHATGPTLASFTGWEWLLIALLISIILISIIGNCLVCVAIFTDRRLRKLGNAFIVSLAIADLFVSCLVMTFALCNDLMNYWMFGEWFCDIWISFDIMCSTASILNLCAISLDRFIHIKDCLLYNQLMTKRVAISAVIIIWIISALVSFVPINLGWHKPNHFKQPVNNISNPDGGQLLDLVAASLNNEPQVSPMEHVGSNETPPRVDQLDSSSDQNDDGALNSENRKLALIGHDGVEHNDGQEIHRDDARGPIGGDHARERHKRHASVKHSIIEPTSENHQLHWPPAASNELGGGEKISEISQLPAGGGGGLERDEKESQIANKLRQPSSSCGGRQKKCDDSAPQSLIAPDTSSSDEVGALTSGRNHQNASPGRNAALLLLAPPLPLSLSLSLPLLLPRQPDGKLKQLANLETHLGGANPAADATAQVPSNSLRCGERSGSSCLSRPPARQSNDYDGSKQSSPGQARELHKNELSDQVAVSPAGEFNPETQRRRRRSTRAVVHKQHAGQEPLEQIKHSQSNPSSRPLPPLVPTTATELASNIYKRIGGRVGGGQELTLHIVKEYSTWTKTTTTLNAGRGGQTDQAKLSKDRLDGPENVATTRWRRDAGQSARGLEMDSNSQTAADGRHQAARGSSKQTRDARTGGQQQQLRRTSSTASSVVAPVSNELPQCMLTLTPTYAVISSTISFYIPCIIMLGLYSKLFACARRHVRNIKAISKAPQPIGFGSPAESPMGALPPMREAPATTNVLVGSGIPNDSGCGGGEIINGRRANTAAADAPNRQEQQPASSWSSSQTVADTTTTTAANNNATGGHSLSSQCRAKLARLVRRPESKLVDRSRTWIKFGRQPSAMATLKPQARGGANLSATAAGAEAESSLSTSAKVPLAHVHIEANSQKTSQSACSPLLMKLNSNQNVRPLPMTTIRKKIDGADYNDGSGIEMVDDENKTIARGNEMEPFLNGHGDRQLEQRSELGLMNRPQAGEESLGGGDNELDKVGVSEERNVTNPSRLEAIDDTQPSQILSSNYMPIRSTPLKSSINSNHSHHHHHHHHQYNASYRRQNQQQQSKQQTNQLATHKAAITLGIIMGTFLFCWVPFFCLNIIKAYHGDSIPASLFRAFTWLGYANSALNPIIYGIHNSEFRNAFNRIFFKHLTLKNGRQYLNRRFSYDLRPHNNNNNNNSVTNHHHNQNQQQLRWRPINANQQNQHHHNHCFETRQQQPQQFQPSQLRQNPSQQPVSTPSLTTITGERDMTFTQTHQASAVTASSQLHHQLEVQQ